MSKTTKFRFQLFVAGGAQNSAQALVNLRAICLAHLPGRHSIEVIDVFRTPQRALDESVFMTPTLIKLAPKPVKRIVGTLGETHVVLQTLGLAETALHCG